MNFYYPLDINQQKIKIPQTPLQQQAIDTTPKNQTSPQKTQLTTNNLNTSGNMQIECAKE